MSALCPGTIADTSFSITAGDSSIAQIAEVLTTSISHMCGSLLAAIQGSRFEMLRVPHTGLGCHF